MPSRGDPNRTLTSRDPQYTLAYYTHDYILTEHLHSAPGPRGDAPPRAQDVCPRIFLRQNPLRPLWVYI